MTKIKTSDLLIRLSIAFILLTIILLFIHNKKLNNNKDSTQHIAAAASLKERISYTKKMFPNAKIVINEKRGIWEKSEKFKIDLIPEFELYGNSEPETDTTYISGVHVLDDESFIYVFDNINYGRIKKYSYDGNYITTIGEKGDGPGGMQNFVRLKSGDKNTLFVYTPQTSLIHTFSQKGTFIDAIRMELTGLPASPNFESYNDTLFYFSKLVENKVIHIINKEGKLIHSFGMPCYQTTTVTHLTQSIHKNNSRGRLKIVDQKLYYSQNNPYEIRKYTLNGELESVIFRKNDFMPPAFITLTPNGSSSKSPPHSVALMMYDTLLVNAVGISPIAQTPIRTILDFFTKDGILLGSYQTTDRLYPQCIDKHGKLWAIHYRQDQYPIVTRYKISITL